MDRVVVIIPAYQEARNIAELVERVKPLVPSILVIDDGSTDGTAELGERAGAQVIRNAVNSGKGYSIRAGFERVLEMNAEAAIIMDGDLQHLPEELPLFLDQWKKSGADLIVGARSVTFAEMPALRKVTNQFMSFLISRVCGQEIPDTQCGFRLLSRRAMQTVLAACRTTNYDFETEMLFVAARSGYTIASVPVTTVYRDGVSKIRPLPDTLRFLRLLSRYAFSTRSPLEPRNESDLSQCQ